MKSKKFFSVFLLCAFLTVCVQVAQAQDYQPATPTPPPQATSAPMDWQPTTAPICTPQSIATPTPPPALETIIAEQTNVAGGGGTGTPPPLGTGTPALTPTVTPQGNYKIVCYPSDANCTQVDNGHIRITYSRNNAPNGTYTGFVWVMYQWDGSNWVGDESYQPIVIDLHNWDVQFNNSHAWSLSFSSAYLTGMSYSFSSLSGSDINHHWSLSETVITGTAKVTGSSAAYNALVNNIGTSYGETANMSGDADIYLNSMPITPTTTITPTSTPSGTSTPEATPTIETTGTPITTGTPPPAYCTATTDGKPCGSVGSPDYTLKFIVVDNPAVALSITISAVIVALGFIVWIIDTIKP